MSKSAQANPRQALFRAIPPMDACLKALDSLLDGRTNPDAGKNLPAALVSALKETPRLLLHEAAEAFWNGVREDIRKGSIADPSELSLERRFADMVRFVARQTAPRLARVLNGTGVVIHTNTGRSVLAPSAICAMTMAASGNTTLEFDRTTGGRGSRNDLLRDAICALTGAEDAIAVNNNAAGVLLAMDTFCRGGEAIISRGELVEIGGSFRIPDVMEATGVTLREVGTTNRTHAVDYEKAISEQTRAIVRVHTSNYRIIGFHSAVPTDELAAMAHAHGLPLINDLGSGSLIPLAAKGLPPEPTVPEAIAQSSDLVLFSGDKLLGGPQAGIIAGRRDCIARLRKNPLLRALRLDKLVYAALEATLRLYYDPETARREVPTVRRILMTPDELRERARSLKRRLRRALGDRLTVTLLPAASRVGGGAFPEYGLPTTLVGLQFPGLSAMELRERLLGTTPIVIGRIEKDIFCLDPRSLSEGDTDALLSVLSALIA